MRNIITIAFLLFAAAASAQVVRGAGIVYTNGAPSHNPGSLGSPQGIDTITGYWYQYDYTNAVWRQAGFWLQPTGTSGTPSYTPAKQRQLFAINTGDSIFYYRSGAWRLLNGPPVAGTNIDVSGRTVTLDTLGLVRFKTDQTYANGTGSLGWNTDSETVVLGLDGGVYHALGLDQLYHVVNDTTITLAKGRLVRASGASGASGKLKAKYYAANMGIHGRYVLGIVSGDIATGDEGYVTSFGLVRGINASGSLYGESWAIGDILYAHPTIAGGLTKTEPTAPNERVVVAMVVSNSASVGSIFVRPQFPFSLGEIRDVVISNPQDNEVLTYNSATGLWQNEAAQGGGIQYSDTTSLIATQYYVDSQGFLTSEVDGSTTNELQSVDTFSIVSDSLRLSLTNDGVPYSAVNLGDYKQTLSVSGDSLFISNGNGVQLPPTTIDTATYLTQDTILVYYANGIEFGRDTIRPAAGGASLSGGVASYVTQWTSATAIDTTGVIWTGGQLGIRETSPTATLNVKGVGSTSATSSLLVENSADVAKLVVKDDGAIEIGRNASGTLQPVASITVTGSETNIGLALVTKGEGAFTRQIPDNGITGGAARGEYAVDLQVRRSVSNEVASGTYSFVGTGDRLRATGAYSGIVVGNLNAALNDYACILGGRSNSASSLYTFVGGGWSNTASASFSWVGGGYQGSAALYGQSANASGRFGGNSDAQTSNIRLRRSITGEAATELFLDGSSERAILALPTGATAGRVWNAKIQIVATVSVAGTADTIVAGSSFVGNYAVGIKRIGSNTSLIGTVQDLHTPLADTAMDDAVVSITADDTNEALRIQFTPPADAESNTVIRVVATVYLTEVGY